MADFSRGTCRNLLLNALSDDDFEAVAPHLEHRRYERGDSIIPPGAPIEQIVFPEQGIFSIVLESPTIGGSKSAFSGAKE